MLGPASLQMGYIACRRIGLPCPVVAEAGRPCRPLGLCLRDAPRAEALGIGSPRAPRNTPSTSRNPYSILPVAVHLARSYWADARGARADSLRSFLNIADVAQEISALCRTKRLGDGLSRTGDLEFCARRPSATVPLNLLNAISSGQIERIGRQKTGRRTYRFNRLRSATLCTAKLSIVTTSPRLGKTTRWIMVIRNRESLVSIRVADAETLFEVVAVGIGRPVATRFVADGGARLHRLNLQQRVGNVACLRDLPAWTFRL
jgi:hypothetical protein